MLACANLSSINIPINIPGQSTATVTSVIDVTNGGTISDLNVPRLKGTYNLVKDIRVTLISPEGTSVLLFSGVCPGSNTQTFNLSLDDQAPTDIDCPPLGGPFQVEDLDGLSEFIGEEAAGIWTLEIKVLTFDGQGGSLDEWELEICSNASPSPPVIVNNNTLGVPPGMENWILAEELLCEDSNNLPEDLDFTIVTPPLNGDLYYNNAPMLQGGIFRQSTINAGNLSYVHNGGAETTDSFVFTVSDGEGGWIPMTTFDIEIDENATVNTSEIGIDNELLVYPNPATNFIMLKNSTGVQEVRIFNLIGRQVTNFTDISQGQSYPVADLPNGMYLVQLIDANNDIMSTHRMNKR